MASGPRAPKQWCLTKTETVNSFENWRQNLLYSLSLDQNFAPFLTETARWEKKTRNVPLRGMVSDNEDTPGARTAQQKVTMLELMLGQIANFCPVISRSTVVKNSTSVQDIWQAIRLHYGFQSTGGHFIDFADIRLEADERPEDLYQRLVAFAEDNLLQAGGVITHHSIRCTEDEELSPTAENLIVLTWLRLIHSELPRLVKQRYGTELRTRTLASIKPEISQALPSLLDEINSHEGSRVMRTALSTYRPTSRPFQSPRTPLPRNKQSTFFHTPRQVVKVCPLCKQAGRSKVDHFLSQCFHLPEHDRKFIAKARLIDNIIDNVEEEDRFALQEIVDTHEEECIDNGKNSSKAILRVQVSQSPYFDTFYGHQPVRVTLDSGATGNMIRASAARSLGVEIEESSQSASQADGRSPLNVVGEVRIKLTNGDNVFFFEGLVTDTLDVDVLGGTPFMIRNDIAIRPKKREITLENGKVLKYGSNSNNAVHSIRRACVLRAPNRTTTVYPGEFLEVPVPESFATHDMSFALEPRCDSPISRLAKTSQLWPSPSIVSSVAGKIRIPNLKTDPIVLKRNEHFCQIHHVSVPSANAVTDCIPPMATSDSRSLTSAASPCNTCHTTPIQLDPDNVLSQRDRHEFKMLHDRYNNVFDPTIQSYNGHYGPFEAVVNMGPTLPPQRKGRIPQYNNNRLVELQQKFDELESMGVFAKPEDVNITVEYLNPSFLVNKPSGGSRLVTAFSDVGRYAKPQPSLMPNVDSTLRQIGQWTFIISTDLTKAFYQIPLSRDSLKYCGVVTPFRGVRVYTRSAMGMPGSETALEELMCRVLGDLLQDGVVAKLADDLYCGANTVKDLLLNWSRVLEAVHRCGLKLSAPKTVICPKSTTILGWIWRSGTIEASPHRIATLATCARPGKVGGLRSFIGAYKVLARVIPNCSVYLAPLDAIVAGQQSQSDIIWSEDQCSAFDKAQSSLSTHKAITLPCASDQLWIVTDGSVKQHGIGATMYVSRNNKLHIAGFFSAKLRDRQMTWLPCELEALGISAAVKHFSPYIIQSDKNTCILTDSKPCVQAFEKLCRGEFSASPRVSTFLSTVCRYQCSVRHIKGSSNAPSDFASRNAPMCTTDPCQICSFVRQQESSTVMRTSIQDILLTDARVPFTGRPTWLAIQSECPDLRRTHSHLRQGTRPSKKVTNAKDVKRYLNVASIAQDSLLVVKRDIPLASMRECIIVPRSVVDGLLTALHLHLKHPSSYQLKSVFSRYFYALDVEKCVDLVSSTCHECAALRPAPHRIAKQSTSDPPEAVGISFAADVIKRYKQLILLVRECSTSYTMTSLITDERKDTLRDALIRLVIGLCPLDGPFAIIRTDAAPGFSALSNDELLNRHRITIEVGRIKNPNRNPIAEKAIRELEDELLRQNPGCRGVNDLSLATATATLNSRIRNRGLSARELWFQRDQFNNTQIPISDYDMLTQQHEHRLYNHKSSESSKAPRGKLPTEPTVNVGDLVYLYSDRSKLQARSRYLVTSVDHPWCYIRKFIGSQLRKTSYKVKLSECYRVPQALCTFHPTSVPPDELSDEDSPVASGNPPIIPGIPSVLTHPLSDSSYNVSEHPNSVPSTHTSNVQPPDGDGAPLEVSSLSWPNDTQPILPNAGMTPNERPTRIRRPPTYLQEYDTSY